MSAGYGDILKKAREEKGYKYADVHRILKVDPAYLKAMEDETPAIFEKKIYMRLFLKTYAKFLKVNADEVISLFVKSNPFPEEEVRKKGEKAMNIAREEPEIQNEEKSGRGLMEFTVSNPRNMAILIGGVAALIIIIVLIVMLAGRGKNKNDEAKNVYVVPQQQETLRVIAHGKDDVWMKARYDGKEEDFFLKKGQEKEWKDMDRIVFLVGNAAGVEFNVNGESIGSIGEEGEVINGLVFQAGKNWYIDRSQGFKRDNKPAETSASSTTSVAPAGQTVPAAAAVHVSPAAGGNQ